MSQHAPNTRAPRRAPRTRSITDTRTNSGKPARAPRPVTPPVKSDLELKLEAALALPEPPERTFAELGLPKPMVLALNRRGITAPFAIQARALPDALAGLDVLGRAQTGSGKTLAFGLPMLARLATTGQPARAVKGRAMGTPRGLVLVPTRELAKQVADNLVAFGHTVDLKVAMVYGGAPINRQIAALRAGVDVVVATPGRLIDLLERKALNLDWIEISVLDEADHMADMGFLPDVRRILAQTPDGGQRLLFSATLDKAVERLVREYLPNPVVHAVPTTEASIDAMTHLAFTLRPVDKVAVAARIASRPARTLFFVRTKRGADRLAKDLSTAGAPALAIHGNLNQNQRQRALDAFTSGAQRVLVATDVAARGIHVDDVDLVVHFDPPVDDKTYLHRSGRTARAGSTGTVLSLVEHSQRREVANLHRQAGVEPATSDVTPESSEVLAIAASGTPVPVVALVPAVRVDRPKSAARRGGRPADQDKNRQDLGRAAEGRRSPSFAGSQHAGRPTAGGPGNGRPGTGRPRRLRATG